MFVFRKISQNEQNEQNDQNECSFSDKHFLKTNKTNKMIKTNVRFEKTFSQNEKLNFCEILLEKMKTINENNTFFR
jgi:hypothetical protein